MHLARVIGNVWATRKLENFEGAKFLIVEPVDKELKPTGNPLVAAPIPIVTANTQNIHFISKLFKPFCACVGVASRFPNSGSSGSTCRG